MPLLRGEVYETLKDIHKKNPHKEQLNFNASYGDSYFVPINLLNFAIIPLQRSNRQIHDRLDRMHAVLRLVEHQ